MSVTLDEAIRALPEILERLKRIEAEVADLKRMYLGAPSDTGPRMFYDANDLKERGIGRDEAYRVLRRYCQPKAGRRLRITHEQLMDYYSSREG